MQFMPLRRLAAVTAFTLLAAGCAASSGEPTAEVSPETADEQAPPDQEEAPPAEDGPVVVATTAVLGDIIRRVVGADPSARIEVLMEPGVDPHGFAPSAADGLLLREADLVVANGLQLEEGLLSTLESAEEDGANVLRVAEQLDPIEYVGTDDHGHGHDDEHADEDEHAEEDEHADEDEHGHEHGPLDPHVWLDPLRVADMAGVIAEAYAEIAPDAAADVRAAADEVAAEFTALHDDLVEQFSVLSQDQRRLVTNHDALGYLAARYDFEVVGTVIPGSSTQINTSAEAFTGLVELLRETGVRAIFAETTASDRLASALAEEVDDVTVTELYTGSPGEPGSGAETVAGMLRTNAGRIVDALG